MRDVDLLRELLLLLVFTGLFGMVLRLGRVLSDVGREYSRHLADLRYDLDVLRHRVDGHLDRPGGDPVKWEDARRQGIRRADDGGWPCS